MLQPRLNLLILCLLPAYAPGGVVDDPMFVGKARRLFAEYKRFIAPVDRRNGYLSTDPAEKERRRRDLAMLDAARTFDPKGFDRYLPGLTRRYRTEFLGGLERRVSSARRNVIKGQVEGTESMGSFVATIEAKSPVLLPNRYKDPVKIPAVWRP